MQKESILREPWCKALNWVSKIIRRTWDKGPRLKMYKSFARKLVGKGDWYTISLFGKKEQVPLMDAIEYLRRIGDEASVPILEDLFYRYAPQLKVGEINKVHKQKNISETNANSPNSCMLKDIQYKTVEPLLELLNGLGLRSFIQETIRYCNKNSLSPGIIKKIVRFSIDNQMVDLAELFLEVGIDLKQMAYDNSNECEKLHSYEELVYGAYVLFQDKQKKDETLELLIAEYNNPKALDEKIDPAERMSHEVIDIIMCRIIHENLADDIERQEEIITRLIPERYKADMKRYRRYVKQKIK